VFWYGNPIKSKDEGSLEIDVLCSLQHTAILEKVLDNGGILT